MKVIDFNEWKKEQKSQSYHLKVDAPIETLNDREIRVLIGDVVERLNFTIDQLYFLFENSLETTRSTRQITSKLVENQNQNYQNQVYQPHLIHSLQVL